jgi:acyl-CoA thioester hydrolase
MNRTDRAFVLAKMDTITFDLDTFTHQIDFSGYISNLTYQQWMEIAEQKLLEAVALPVPTLQRQGLNLILVQTETQYWRTLSLGDRVRVEVWVTNIQSSSLTIKIQFLNQQGHVVVEGSRQELFVETESRRPKQLTPELQSCFRPYLRD